MGHREVHWQVKVQRFILVFGQFWGQIGQNRQIFPASKIPKSPFLTGNGHLTKNYDPCLKVLWYWTSPKQNKKKHFFTLGPPTSELKGIGKFLYLRALQTDPGHILGV